MLRALGGWRRVFRGCLCGVSPQLLRGASLFGAATAVFPGVLGAGAGNGSYAGVDGDGMCGAGGVGGGDLRAFDGGLLRQGRGVAETVAFAAGTEAFRAGHGEHRRHAHAARFSGRPIRTAATLY